MGVLSFLKALHSRGASACPPPEKPHQVSSAPRTVAGKGPQEVSSPESLLEEPVIVSECGLLSPRASLESQLCPHSTCVNTVNDLMPGLLLCEVGVNHYFRRGFEDF